MDFFSTAGFMPHGHCYLWKPSLVALHSFSDLIIFLSYAIIPIGIRQVLIARNDLPDRKIFWLFIAFILLCGFTHLNEIYAIWHPNYWFSGFLKLLTAIVSAATAYVLMKLIPKILNLPNFKKMAEAADKEVTDIMERISSAIVAIDDMGSINYVNKRAIDMFGYTQQDELIGQSLQALIPERFRHGHEGNVKRFFKAGDSRLMGGGQTFYGLRKDGSEFPLQIGLSMVDSELGRRVIATIVDQSELQQREAELRQLHQRYEQAITGSKHAFWIWKDLEGTEVWWSEGLFEFLDIPKDEKPTLDLYMSKIHPDDLPSLNNEIKKSIESDGNFEATYRILVGDGSYRWVCGKGSIIQSKLSSKKEMSGSLTDVTNMEEARKEMAELNQSLSQSNEELRNFVHVVSHDLRAPLRHIRMNIDVLASEGVAQSDDSKEALAAAQRNVSKMGNMITGLLTLSKIDKDGINYKILDLDRFFLNLKKELDSDFDQVGGQLVVEPSGIEITTDETLIERVIENLLLNSIAYRRNDNNLDVRLSAKREENSVIIVVVDNGQGISDSFLPFIFTPFSRGSNQGSSTSLGLGLSICQKIVNLLGGSISVESQLGAGTTFYVELRDK